jgi:shikimate kinase
MGSESDRQSTVLIGPYGVGKSTISHLLAEAREQQRYSLDEVVWTYYSEVGVTPQTAAAVGAFDAPDWQRYHAHAVKRFLQDHANESCVMDLGAGHALFEGALLTEMQTVLADCTVILLLPAPEIDIAKHDLGERNAIHPTKRQQPHAEWNAFFLQHPAPHQLADHVVYTKGKSPAQTCAEILALLQV